MSDGLSMEWSSDPDSSFSSSLNPTSSKEDLFSTSQRSSTSDFVDIKMALGLQTDPLFLSSPSTNPSCFSSPACPPSVCKEDTNSRKSSILPQSLLLSVTKKVREGTVSSKSKSPLPTYSTPGLQNGSSDKLQPQISPLSVNNSIDSPVRLLNTLDSNISDIDSNSSFGLKLEVSADSDEKGLSANSDTSICTIYSDDETRNKLKVEKPKRKVPNYFISIQFSDPEIYQGLKEVQKSVMKKNGNYSLAVVPLHSLHMTLAVMRLETEEDMVQAKSALNRCGDELRPKYRHKLLELPLEGLGNFRHSVVFAKVCPGEHVTKLDEIAAVVQKEFCKEGLIDDKNAFTPHVTVLKLSRVGKKLTKKTGLKKIYPDIYEEFIDTYFGTQTVHSLQLCSMLKAKDISGYYQVDHKIDFGTEMTPDDDCSTPMAMVIEENEDDSSNETIKESTTKQNQEITDSKNPEDITLKNDILTNTCSCEKKMKLDCDLTLESSDDDIRMYKSETFIYISSQEDDDTSPRQSISREKTISDNSRTRILRTSPEEAQIGNISSVQVNRHDDLLNSAKLVDDYKEIKEMLEVTEKILEMKANVRDNESSSGEALLQGAVFPKSDLSYKTVVPRLIISPAELVTNEVSFMDVINLDNGVDSTPINLEDAITDNTNNIKPSIASISDTGNVTPKTDLSTAVPTLILSPAEIVTDKAHKKIADVFIGVDSDPINFKEASPNITISKRSSATTPNNTGYVAPSVINSNNIPGNSIAFQNITLTNDTGVSDVSDVSEITAEHNHVFSPPSSSRRLGDLEVAEEATEGLVSIDSVLGSNQAGGYVSGCDEIGEDKDASSAANETIDSLNIVPPFMKKRRKKIAKCSVM